MDFSHAVVGCFSTKRIRTSDLALLKPYFHGTTTRTGAPFCAGSTSPYIPNVSSVSGCMASSIRRPSVYGQSITGAPSPGICFRSASVTNSTNLALPVGSTRLISSDSGKPTHGTTADQASTQRSRYTRSSSGASFINSSMSKVLGFFTAPSTWTVHGRVFSIFGA